MDAEKVQNKDGDQQQRIQFRILHRLLEGAAQCRDGLRRFPCRDRLKSDDLLAVRQFFGNHIVRILEAAADGLTAELVQVPVKLQNDIRPRRDVVMALMNRREHVAVSGNLLFAAGLGHSFLADDLFQTVVRRNNAFDAVGCLGTLNPRNLQQAGKRIRLGFDEKILLSLVFMNLCEVGHDLWRQKLIVFCFEVKGSHSSSSFAF